MGNNGKFNNVSLKERLLNGIRVNEKTGCWEWQKGISSSGYGIISLKHKSFYTHRVSYIEHFGDIPNGLLVCHTCDNKVCCNPDHFFLGTDRDNALDAQKKGITKTASCPSMTMYDRGCRCSGCRSANAEKQRRLRKNRALKKATIV